MAISAYNKTTYTNDASPPLDAPHLNNIEDQVKSISDELVGQLLRPTTEKTTLVNADEVAGNDSADSFKQKRTTWTNVKAFLKTYFDTLYMALTGNQTVAGVKTFSSSPVVPTPAVDNNTTNAASTAFVIAQAGGSNPLVNGAAASGSSLRFSRMDHVHPIDTSRAPLASPGLTGTPTAPTAAAGTNTTQLATTEFVNAEIAADTDYLADFKLYDATKNYGLNEPTFYLGVPYRSLTGSGNTGNTPDNSPLFWEITGGGGGAAVSPGYTFDNGQIEGNVVGYSTYADAAGDMPVDGIGGTANITFVASATLPLVGTGSGLLTKDAVNRQGQGFSKDFTIDAGLTSSPAQFKFLYSGDFVYGDIGFYIIETDTGTVITPNNNLLSASFGIPLVHIAQFFPLKDKTAYRACWHIASTSALAYTMKIDDITLGSKETIVAPAVTPFIDYPAASYVFPSSATPVAFAAGKLPIGAVTTNPTKGTISVDMAKWSRSGSKLLINANFRQSTAGTGGSGIYLLPLPAPYTVNLSDCPINSLVGEAFLPTSVATTFETNGVYFGNVFVYNDTFLYLKVLDAVSANQQGYIWTSTFGGLASGNVGAHFTASVSCAQFSVNASFNGMNEPMYLANNQSTINANGSSPATQTVSGMDGTPILANTAAPYYDILLPRALQQNEVPEVQVRSKIDGTWINYESASSSIAGTGSLVAHKESGQGNSGISLQKTSFGVLRVQFWNGGARQMTGDSVISWSAIVSATDGFDRWRVRIGQAGLSEVKPSVFADYYSNANYSPTTTPVLKQFDTKVMDTHNAVTVGSSWKFTAPVNGLYEVATCYITDNATVAQAFNYFLYKNGNAGRRFSTAGNEGTNTNLNGAAGSIKVYLNANEYVQVFVSSAISGNGTILSGIDSWIQITRIGD